jgi:hypothetical protein
MGKEVMIASENLEAAKIRNQNLGTKGKGG